MSDPTISSPSHPTEEILEEYVFHRLPETVAVPLEEHLLICHRCQDVVSETDLFVSALKTAAQEPVPQAGFSRLASLGAARTLAPLLVLAALGFVAVRVHQVREPPSPAAVTLSSLRGLDLQTPAPAGKPLQLSIETPDLTFGNQYRIEVVDAGGGPVWRGPVMETGGKLITTMSKPLGPGVYWIRLYGEDSQLLREFGMSAK